MLKIGPKFITESVVSMLVMNVVGLGADRRELRGRCWLFI